MGQSDKSCGCKGANYCLQCSSDPAAFISESSVSASYIYCPLCKLAWPGWGPIDAWRREHPHHNHHSGPSLALDGVTVALDVMSEHEERRLLADIDSLPWHQSQSGRRKQNFGPRCNFKRRRLSVAGFAGFPWFGRWLQHDLIGRVPALADFTTIEQCSLEYRAETGACISPHVDDCWVWGERVVSINMLSDSVLTLIPYTGTADRYNLSCAGSAYSGRFSGDDAAAVAVRIPMPRRSVLVLSGEARYDWLHCVLRDDIADRRVCVALREFTRQFQTGGEQQALGADVMRVAQRFWTKEELVL